MYKDLNHMFEEVTLDILTGDTYPDAYTDSDAVYVPNVVLSCEGLPNNLDIGRDFWFNRSRWTKLVKEYIRRSSIESFIQQGRGIYLGRDGLATAGFVFNTPEQRGNRKWWGGCLSSMYFSHIDVPRITLVSRTTYWNATAAIDAAIAQRVADFVTEGEPGLVEFEWYIGTLNFNYIRGIPFFTTNQRVRRAISRLRRQERDDASALNECAPYIMKMTRELRTSLEEMGPEAFVEEESYQVMKQIKKKYAQGPQPSIDVKSLDFTKCEY